MSSFGIDENNHINLQSKSLRFEKSLTFSACVIPSSIVFVSDLEILLFGDQDGNIHSSLYPERRLYRKKAHQSYITLLKYFQDKKLVFSASADKCVKIHRLKPNG